ncbi:xanthine dehydrogenase family protein molybdopterin-binding subunit [Mucilaginibacter terrenus]|uniref:Xanthine dehydrogenase family protein molybdopterin-binding subunit n=1 Tax=Mucilaginibacter terrenus TaxID=2482727 RepID=A0A3E2NXH6_9SPHI|nr:xanthine dehydrogenase family protein molybdopterin-binding subunit [Mucilaginibacter terrenus]RFZ85726.1 xanthine dehydrogenase family protein molybdopterin-binding subunit [Mucilaginibacter terrenus]
MEMDLMKTIPTSADGMSRVDGRAKVTGAAKYSAEHKLPGMVYAVLVMSTITKGTIASIESKAAEKAPGVLAVLSHLNAPKVPGHQKAKNPAKPEVKSGPLRVFNDNKILYNGHPVAMVVADTFERAQYGASLVKVTYDKEAHQTKPPAELKGKAPWGGKDDIRGTEDAWQSAPVKLEAEYIIPTEVHNPMELHAIIARWDAPDKLTVWDKTQGAIATRDDIAKAFNLKKEDVQVNSKFVGGAFGSALQVWPHEIAAVLGAKVVKHPVKLVLTRPDMFTSVGYRPYTWQKIGIGATADGKLVGITHEATGQTSTYEDFAEGPIGTSKGLYECPNVTTRYRLISLDVNTPTWMRGPGEATGAFALESALDELSYQLKMDPIDLRMKNYAKVDPENKKEYSSKYLDEAYQMGAKQIGWSVRKAEPGTLKENGWLVGYGMAGGMFGAYRDTATVRAIFNADGTLVLQTAVSDIGPGTGTAAVSIAAEQLGIAPEKIKFEMGDSSLPYAPMQGGSSITSTVGSAVHDACVVMKEKFQQLMGNGGTDKLNYVKILNDKNLPSLEVLTKSQGGPNNQKYSMQSWSVHFVRVLVHPATGVVKINKVACVADSGHIVSPKTARSQIVGGAIGGIGMALMEEGVIDHRYGRYVNNNLADYHVPVNADIPQIDAIFVNKPDPYINPIGAKGMGEIALIGMSAAVANAVYNATGKRVRDLPITPDKLIG